MPVHKQFYNKTNCIYCSLLPVLGINGEPEFLMEHLFFQNNHMILEKNHMIVLLTHLIFSKKQVQFYIFYTKPGKLYVRFYQFRALK